MLLFPFKEAGHIILSDSRERPETKRLKIVFTRATFALVGNPILKKNGFIRFDKHALPVPAPLSYIRNEDRLVIQSKQFACQILQRVYTLCY